MRTLKWKGEREGNILLWIPARDAGAGSCVRERLWTKKSRTPGVTRCGKTIWGETNWSVFQMFKAKDLTEKGHLDGGLHVETWGWLVFSHLSFNSDLRRVGGSPNINVVVLWILNVSLDLFGSLSHAYLSPSPPCSPILDHHHLLSLDSRAGSRKDCGLSRLAWSSHIIP